MPPRLTAQDFDQDLLIPFEDKAHAAFATLDQAKTREDFLAAVAWLDARADGNGKLGAAVPFYGNSPAPEEAAKVKAPLLAWDRSVAFFKARLAA